MDYGTTFLKRLGATTVAVAAALLAGAVMTSSAWGNTPVSGAVFTTVNPTVDVLGVPHCLNGGPSADAGLVNCNRYNGKQYVWLSGGPDGNQPALADGAYFFAVLVPGGQGANAIANPNDGTALNLSDTEAAPYASGATNADGTLIPSGDVYSPNRTFTVSGGIISYSGPHDFSNNKIRLMPYDDTTNSGGVYILAVCNLADATNKAPFPGANPSDCKYDAFIVQEGNTPPQPDGLPLTVTKSANGSYDNTYAWNITKSVDKTLVKQVGGSVTFTYTVNVTHDAGTFSNFKVTGTITVTNPNVDASNNPVPVQIDGIVDVLSNGVSCTVTNGGAQPLTAVKTDFPYECILPALPQGQLDNTVSVLWSDQPLANDSYLFGGQSDFTFNTGIAFTANPVDECVGVTDSYKGFLGTVCVGDATTSFTYSRTILVPQYECVSYDNTATFTTSDTGTTGSASQTVTVCGPAKTGALTIGFWKGPNGQGLIKTYCISGTNNLGTYLAGLGAGSGPFSTAPSSCSSLATYVSGILTGASATDMNKMVKAQMLGTALDVWFSGAGWTSTTVNKVKPPSIFLSHNNLGAFKMDTTAVCPMVDDPNVGSATCKNNTPSTDAVAAGAVPTSPMGMQAILDYAATTPTPFNVSTSSSVWYAGNRTLQEILKNIFDQFNNQLAFGSF